MTDEQLFYEELRQQNIELKASIDSLIKIFKEGKIDVGFQPTDKVKIDGAVQVNTQKEVTVDNLETVVDELKALSDTLADAIKNNAHKPLEAVTVKNIDKAKTEAVKITNLSELKDYIASIGQAIKDNQPIVNVTKQEIVFPTAPNKPIAVRLSDGKGWINALTQAVAAASPEVDVLANYQLCERDDGGSTKYYGYAKANGYWYIMRESSTGSYRYAKGAPQAQGGGLFADAWTDRANLNYDYIFEVFK